MKFLSLFVLFYNFAAIEGRLFGRDCSQYDNKKDCIKYYQCSWCNNTIDNDGNLGSIGNNSNNNNNSNSIVVTTCKNYLPCINDDQCVYSDDLSLNTECVFVNILVFTLLILGFVVMLGLLLYSINNLLAHSNIPLNVKKSIISLVSFIVIIPNLLFFFINTQYFIYYYVTILITAFFASSLSRFYIKRNQSYQLLHDNDIPEYSVIDTSKSNINADSEDSKKN